MIQILKVWKFFVYKLPQRYAFGTGTMGQARVQIEIIREFVRKILIAESHPLKVSGCLLKALEVENHQFI